MGGYSEKKLRRALANIDARLTEIEAGIRGDTFRRVTRAQSVKEQPKGLRRSGANLLLAALDAYHASTSQGEMRSA